MQDTILFPLIDCRPLQEYCQGHIQGATSIPAGQLFFRMHELAQKHIPVTLCGDINTLSIARDFFIARDFIIAREILWPAFMESAITGSYTIEYGTTSARLWKPAELISEFVTTIAPECHHGSKNGLDIACGAGRDTVYLAMHGWNMLGVDNSPEALQRLQQLADYNHVHISSMLVDLEKHENPSSPIPGVANNSIDLICVFRYLHRPLFPALQRMLKPGGFIIYQTFMEGCEKISSPRNPRYLLKQGELATIFDNYRLHKNDIVYLQDGRPISALIAQKPTIA